MTSPFLASQQVINHININDAVRVKMTSIIIKSCGITTITSVKTPPATTAATSAATAAATTKKDALTKTNQNQASQPGATFSHYYWSPHLSVTCQFDLDFSAPECHIEAAADIQTDSGRQVVATSATPTFLDDFSSTTSINNHNIAKQQQQQSLSTSSTFNTAVTTIVVDTATTIPATATATNATITATPSSSWDMFSFGLLICSIFNDGKSILSSGSSNSSVSSSNSIGSNSIGGGSSSSGNISFNNYMKQVAKLPDLFSDVSKRMPSSIVEPVEKLLDREPTYRPTAQLFMLLKCFDDPIVQCLRRLDSILQKDTMQKIDFFNRLNQVIPKIPPAMQYTYLIPFFDDMLQQREQQLHQTQQQQQQQLPQQQQPDNLTLLLPSLLCLIQLSSLEDYRLKVKPLVSNILNMQKSTEITIYILERLEIILSKSNDSDIQTDVLPMVFHTLETNSVPGHEAAISIFDTIRRYIDDSTIKNLILPRTKTLFLMSNNVLTKLNALACLDRLIDSFDKMTVLEEVLPFLTEITCSDVDITMAIIAIYRHLLSDRKYGLTHNILATKVIPSLIPYAVAPGLTIAQFTQLIELLREMLGQVDQQRRLKMMGEAPNILALEGRSNLQQMHVQQQQQQQQTPPTPNIRLPDDNQSCASGSRSRRVSCTSSISNSSNFSGYFGKRLSQDFRFNMYEPNSPLNKYLLTVDRRNSINRYGCRQAPSNPELQARTSSKDSLLSNQAYRKCSSFTGLGSEEKTVLERIVRDRRASMAPRGSISTGAGAPHIHVSEASLGVGGSENNFGGWSWFGSNRRCSTQSVGPVVQPEPGRRSSQGKILDSIQNELRRASFQGICESAVQFFSGK
ncbi:hypothetical protein HELRODRAFT_191964 [Helobdella robusta]|uniref:SCY1-like protein 2 n=1 Tax=Helobdella robusta TaxID=6412 RepID=T1FTG6_HELRO|nr:hypothetical protein HELRODRAFT_191964 [Helobdella robusta]ESO03808.1 hypothetical protein HELRODRAFT_191964 [Helobdella robusta]